MRNNELQGADQAICTSFNTLKPMLIFVQCLKIESVPQRDHDISPLQRSSGSKGKYGYGGAC
jgi:hypothetical protein